MLKSIYSKLAFISTVVAIALLIALPEINFKFQERDYKIGGYNISILDGKFTKDLRTLKRGLDLEGGVKIVFKADTSKINSSDVASALESSKEIISRRINLLGVSEPYIATSKVGEEHRIVVELPGVEDVNSAAKLIGQTAQLNFRELSSEVEYSEEGFAELFSNPNAWVNTDLTGADLKGVDVVFNQGQVNSAAPQIQLRFTNTGREKFSEIAKRNIDKPIGIFFDESPYPLSMPVVSSDLAEGVIDDPVISGNFDLDTAKNLSVQIRGGALPIPLEIIEQKTIGATLGEESVNRSLFAGVLGLLLVMVFMVFMYGSLGLIANISLIVYTIIVLAVFKIIPVVLTLPGVAGFVLSVGMAADANILIFERIKEEIIWGRAHSIAIRLGFERAWTSIRDSNFTSLLTSAILFYFGSGPVRGFALTLAIGILVSLFTSIFLTRTLINTFNIGKIIEKRRMAK